MVLLLFMVVCVAAALTRRDEVAWSAWVWLAGCVGSVAIRLPFVRRCAGNIVVDCHSHRGDHIVFAAMLFGTTILPLAYAATGFPSRADYVLPWWGSAIGVAFEITFLWLFFRAHADLGRNWSPGLEIRDAHALVTHGVYARSRHPMYVAFWCSAFATPLLLPNAVIGAAALATTAALWVLRIPREEAMLRSRFAAAYDDYARQVPRVWRMAMRG